MIRFLRPLLVAPFLASVAFVACAEGGGEAGGDGGDSGSSTGVTTSGNGGTGGGASNSNSSAASTGSMATSSSTGGMQAKGCPPGDVVVGVDSIGALICEPFENTLSDGLGEACELHFGWRDSCDGCTAAPARWGRVSGSDCSVGVGTGNSCGTYNMNGVSTEMLGVVLGGDVNGDDKFYLNFSCNDPGSAPVTAAICPAGTIATGILNDQLQCQSPAAAAAAYAADSCAAYLGWRDSCNGCTSPPAKWGRTGTFACDDGVGTDNTCSQATLGGKALGMFGLNTDGDVDGNDMFFVGMVCDDAAAQTDQGGTTCPAGMALTGLTVAGEVICSDLADVTAAYAQTKCEVLIGISDNCGSVGCTSIQKWGRSGGASCNDELGADNACNSATLAGKSMQMFGLNADGNVDGNDKVFVGFRCRP